MPCSAPIFFSVDRNRRTIKRTNGAQAISAAIVINSEYRMLIWPCYAIVIDLWYTKTVPNPVPSIRL
jgi:hypothetical protein